MRVGSLCSGYGGLELAATAALAPLQVSTAWHAETDDDASAVLEWRFPDVPNLGDVKTLDPPPVDLLAMGVPCQPASSAGRQLVYDDPRWLWPFALRVLVDLRPPLFVFENVRNLISIRKGTVWAAILADMRAAGYAVRWLTLGACAVGAPHHRHRVFAIGAYVGPDAPPAVRVPVDECGAPRRGKGRDMLLTPRACDGDGDGRTGPTTVRSDGYGPAGLAAQFALLPTPVTTDAKGARNATAGRSLGAAFNGGTTLTDAITLMATPMARDGAGRNEGDAAYWERKRAAGFNGGIPLGAQVTLMATRGQPTPGVAQARLDSGRRNLDDAVAVDFGPYAAAVARWEALRGVPAPEPTEIGPKGGRRLAGPFPEWMMGLDPGWITDVPGVDRRAALKMAGNGVCPQQGAEALRLLLTSERR